jgi:hypothetical protein
MYVYRNIETRSRIIVIVEKQQILQMCVCVCACMCPDAWVYVALLIQHATRMRYIVTSFVAPLATQYFSTLPHKRHDFRENVIGHKMCILIFYMFYLQQFAF